MKQDFTKLKPFNPEPKMQDPVRYPKVIVPIENQMKQNYDLALDKMMVDVTKSMIHFLK